MQRPANATRYLPRRRLLAAKCSNSATLPGRAGGESLGLATARCNVILLQMTHHHHAGEAHPSPALSPSLLRLSAPKRLAFAGALIALIWAAVLWATR
jgi:hypothetical protein